MSNSKIRVHYILEGYEENALFELIEHFSKKTNIEMTYKNCKGGGTIPAFYQEALASDNYDLIYCVYDVDFQPKDDKGMYKRIRHGLYRVLGDESEIDKISICTNPNTLLLLLLGYTDLSNLVEIKSDKKSNTKLINKFCTKIGNKKEYDASEWQLELIKDDYIYSSIASFDKIFESNEIINNDYKSEKIGSNALPFIRALIEDDYEFFDKIIKGE